MNTRFASVLFTGKPVSRRETAWIISLCAATFVAATSLAQESSPAAPASPASSPAAGSMPGPEEMAQMMELAKPGENHKLLAELVGNWNYTVKMWMAPGAPPMTSKGTATRKALMDGRYFELNVSGVFKMPDASGKLADMNFKGSSIEGYDNVKKKFVNTWIDNMGTGIMVSEGTYDPATKTFTYMSEVEMPPGNKTPVREEVKVIDKNHHVLSWYENRGGQEVKTMEIDYTRKG